MRRARRVAVLSAAVVPVLLAFGHALPAADAKAPKVRVPSLRAEARVVTPPGRTTFRPGEPATVEGVLLDKVGHPARGTFSLRVSDSNGRVYGTLPGVATGPDGSFSAVVPGALTRDLRGTADTHWTKTLAVRVVDARSGRVREADAGVVPLAVATPPTGIELVNDFTSSKGWVKPGDTYPSRLLLRNYGTAAVTNVVVTMSEVEGMRVTKAQSSAGTVTLSGGTVTWTVPSVGGTSNPALPTTKTLVLEGRADSTGENPQIVWHDLSTTASMTYDGGTGSSTSHGPKVIPPDDLYNSARYGDRPFPVVPVDFFDRKHAAAHNGEALAEKINDPSIKGSTFNLYQEMSYGQLYPHATVPSAGIPAAPFDEPITFTTPQPNGVCTPDGAQPLTASALQGKPGYTDRIKDGWYQLPGTTQYYGLDRFGPQTALAGSLSGQAILFDIDSACGPTAKGVYDAAAIADEEIDYSDFDTDKDGVVDFFMMVFVGVGGHGASALEKPPYDNIWPHSSSLEFTYTDKVTGQGGYISKDQLKDLEGHPLWYTDSTRAQMTTTPGSDDLKVHVRVGPYNVNPESAIDKASVISHEYGHSLGLPDFYSTGDRETYGDWNLMATDKSQNMDVFSKQDMGWIVPRVLPKGTTKVTGWKDSKVNTHRIDWVTPSGQPYTLSGPDVDNGEAYTAKLKGRQLISPEKVSQGASPSHVWWSGSGNNYGCPPEGGHNLDISLPEMEGVPAGATVKLEFASYWDMEWDYDYGFVLISPDTGETYTSVASEKNYTTPGTVNPNANNCQSRYGNGITGTSGSYQNGTAQADRVVAAPGSTKYPDGPFLKDSYDISALAGTKGAVVRLALATDPGVAHPGWFIDDLVITVNGNPIYKTDFEHFEQDRPRLYNGGCKEDLRVATRCTKGWQWVSSDVAATADHGYYMEMRDRSGFDYDGKGENDRAGIGFVPGMLTVYTNEVHGYGNAGTDDPPAQSPLDAHPTAGSSTPNLNDAAFAVGDSFSDSGWVDNYEDPSSESGNWEFRFGCLSFAVNAMDGDDVGPDSPVGVGGNLVGDVTFKTTPNCAPFNYGYSAEAPNSAPTAVFAVKPSSPRVGQAASFDASASYDDRQAPSDLSYAWTFGDGGSASGRTVSHTYTAAGTYKVALTVTDKDGLSTTSSSNVTVSAASSGGGGNDLPSTGGSEALALLALVGSAAAVLARRRAARSG